jgi:hypothetical protein
MAIAIVLMLRIHALNKKAATGAIVLEGLAGFRYTLWSKIKNKMGNMVFIRLLIQCGNLFVKRCWWRLL